LTTVVSPAQLQAEGVPVFHTFQEPGDFIITFPQAYHMGFSHGFNMAEAANFALPDWLPFGRRAVERYHVTASMRPSCFSHDQLLCNLARHCAAYSTFDCATIAEELRHAIAAERKVRAAVAADGITVSVHLPNEGDPRYECTRCRQICYLSAVVCRCSTGTKRPVSCLRHHRYLCTCPPSYHILVYWYRMADLEKLLDGVMHVVSMRRELRPAAAAAAASTTTA